MQLSSPHLKAELLTELELLLPQVDGRLRVVSEITPDALNLEDAAALAVVVSETPPSEVRGLRVGGGRGRGGGVAFWFRL